MLGKLRKGDLVFTSDDEYAEGISVTEVLKLDGEVVLIRGIDKNDKLQAVTPKEIKSYEYMDTNGDIYHESMQSNQKEIEENLKKMNVLPKDLTLDEFVSGVSSTQRGTISETGSLRYNTGKPKMSNIPPEFLLEMAKIMEMGERKYGQHNWKLGNKMSVPYDSAMRHIFSFINGENVDEESGCSHLAHAAINLMFMYIYQKRNPELDDREEMR